VLACTYALNVATLREKFERHFVPLVLNVMGRKRFAKLSLL